MSTKALFGDDDDDDDDEDDDDDDEVVGNQRTDTTEKTATGSDEKDKKETNQKGKSDKDSLEDSDDDGDMEFDDKGAVVGLSSTTLAGTKLSEKPTAAPLRSGTGGSEDEDGDRDDGNHGSPQKMDVDSPQRPKIDNRSLEFPQLDKPGNAKSMFITKLPNLIGIKTSAFDPNHYHPQLEEEDYGPSAVHNLVRWRYKRDSTGHLIRDQNDKLQRESNTRLVEWSDGSWTLHVGTEAFDVERNDNSSPDGFPGLNGYAYLSQPATISVEGDATGGEPKPAGTVLECFGQMAARVTARPSSLQSEAHKSLTIAVRQRTIKKARIAEIATAEDPEKLKQERIRLKDDAEKQREAAKRKSAGRAGGGGRRPRMSRRYLEEDDEAYDTINLGAEKRRMREDEDFGGFGDYGDDDDLEADDTFNARRPLRGSRRRAAAAAVEAEEEEEEEFQDDDDDDDDDEEAPQVKSKKPTRRAVLDDDDDDSE